MMVRRGELELPLALSVLVVFLLIEGELESSDIDTPLRALLVDCLLLEVDLFAFRGLEGLRQVMEALLESV